MAKKFDRQYLEEHQQCIGTAETFGSAVADVALHLAKEKIGDGQFDSVEINLPITIKPVTIRRSLSNDEAAALGGAGTGTVASITIDCVSVGFAVPPFAASWHIKVQ